MKEQIAAAKEAIENYAVTDLNSAEAFRIHFLGSKGELKNLFGELKNVPNEEKKEVGQLLNGLRLLAEEKLQSSKERFENTQSSDSDVDLTRPAEPILAPATSGLDVFFDSIEEDSE